MGLIQLSENVFVTAYFLNHGTSWSVIDDRPRGGQIFLLRIGLHKVCFFAWGANKRRHSTSARVCRALSVRIIYTSMVGRMVPLVSMFSTGAAPRSEVLQFVFVYYYYCLRVTTSTLINNSMTVIDELHQIQPYTTVYSYITLPSESGKTVRHCCCLLSRV